MDEIKKELGVSSQQEEEVKEYASQGQITYYMDKNQRSMILVAVGVAFCIISTLPFQISYINEGLASIIMFSMIAIGVAIFIITGMNMSDVSSFKEGEIFIDETTRYELSQKANVFNRRFAVHMAIGVGLCILSVFPFLLEEGIGFPEIYESLGIPYMIFLGLIAIGVMIFIISGSKKSMYEIILKGGEKTFGKEEDEDDGLIGTVIPIVAIVYVALGLIFNAWHPGWLLFPLATVITQAIDSFRNKDK